MLRHGRRVELFAAIVHHASIILAFLHYGLAQAGCTLVLVSGDSGDSLRTSYSWIVDLWEALSQTSRNTLLVQRFDLTVIIRNTTITIEKHGLI